MSYAPIQSDATLQHKNHSRLSTLRQNSLDNSAQATHKKIRRGKASRQSPAAFPIIVHCHLCWDWVWQRPQQFISRLSKSHRILFIEMLSPDPALAAPLARERNPKEFPH